MWIRRTSAEIAEVERLHRISRFNPIPPAGMAFGLALLMSILRWGGWRGKLVPPGNPLPIGEAFSGLPVIWIVLFLIIYGYRLFLRNNSPRDGTLICTRCFEAAARYAPPQCPCGGTREPLYLWRWQKDPESSRESTRNA